MSGKKAVAIGIIGMILGVGGLGFGVINMFNINSTNLLNVMQSNYAARVYRDGNWGVAVGGWMTLYFNAESYDPGNNFDTSTYTYSVPETGKYLITGTVTFTNAVINANPYKIAILVNGTSTSVGGLICSTSGELTITITDVLLLSVDDEVYLRYYNPSGAFLTVAGTEDQSFMAITKI